MTSLRDRLALWFSAAHRAAAATVDAVRNPPPPPELAKWHAMPFQREIDHQVSNPIARRILAAIRPSVQPGMTEGQPAKELAAYRGHIREKLEGSDLATRLIDGGGMLPDIADAFPEPWAWWARVTRPRDIEAWARHVRKHLNWYLAPNADLRPALSFWFPITFMFALPRVMFSFEDKPLIVLVINAAFAVTMSTLFLLANSRAGTEKLWRTARSGLLLVAVLACIFYWTFRPWDAGSPKEMFELLLEISARVLGYLGICASFALSINSLAPDENRTRSAWSDAGRINAEELYLYLYDQYRDVRGEVAAAHAVTQASEPPAGGLASLDHIDHIEDRDIDEAPDDPGQDQSDLQDQQNSSAAQAAKEHQ